MFSFLFYVLLFWFIFRMAILMGKSHVGVIVCQKMQISIHKHEKILNDENLSNISKLNYIYGDFLTLTEGEPYYDKLELAFINAIRYLNKNLIKLKLKMIKEEPNDRLTNEN